MALVPYSPARSGTSPTSSLQNALNEFMAALPEAQLKTFKQSTSQPDASSVMIFMSELDASNQRSRKSVAPRLCSLLDSVQQFVGVVDTFVSSKPSIAALIWGSIKTSLVVASNATTYFDKVTLLIMEVGRSSPTFDEFGQLYRYHTGVQSSLCEYYADILRICTKIVQVQQRSQSAFLLSTIATNFELDFKPLRNRVERSEKQLRLQIHLASDQLSHQSAQMLATVGNQNQHQGRSLSRLKSMIRKEQSRTEQWQVTQEQIRASEMRSRILKTLSTENPHKIWSKIHGPRINGTAEWFKTEPTFQNWRTSTSASDTLWLCGTLGVGKSVLVSSIISELQQTSADNMRIAFYFCQRERANSLSATAVLGSITRQLLEGAVAAMNRQDLSLLDKQCDDLDAAQMIDILNQYSIQGVSETCFIIVDGLDECSDDDASTVLKQLSRLEANENRCLKLLYSSRPELPETLANHIRWNAKLTINKVNIEPDVRIYVEEKLRECIEQQKLLIHSESLLLTIADVLERECNGMFLWLALIIEEICDQNSDAAIENILQRPPRRLSDLYDLRYHRVLSHKLATSAVTMLQYAGVARRPLSIDEMKEALTVRLDDREIEPARFSNNMEIMIKACCGLLYMDEEAQTVHYVHTSLYSHLFSDSSRGNPHFDRQRIDNHFGSICMTYLNFKQFGQQVARTRGDAKAKVRPVDLAIAPIVSSKVVHSSVANKILSMRRIRSQITVQDLERMHDAGRKVPLLHFAFLQYAKYIWYHHVGEIDLTAHLKVGELFKTCMENSNIPAVKPWEVSKEQPAAYPNQETKCLEWALENAHYALAQYVLLRRIEEYGLEINSWLLGHIMSQPGGSTAGYPQTRTYKNFVSRSQGTILIVAIHIGSLKLVEHLLDLGADVNLSSEHGNTPLHAAVNQSIPSSYPLGEVTNSQKKIQVDILDRLLLAGADVHARNFDGETAVYRAVKLRRYDMFHRLIEAGANVNDKVGDHFLIHFAIGIADVDAVKALLAAGADLKLCNSEGKSPLCWAVAEGSRTIVELLLEAKANPSDCFPNGESVLQYAERKQLHDIEKLLVAYQALRARQEATPAYRQDFDYFPRLGGN